MAVDGFSLFAAAAVRVHGNLHEDQVIGLAHRVLSASKYIAADESATSKDGTHGQSAEYRTSSERNPLKCASECNAYVGAYYGSLAVMIQNSTATPAEESLIQPF